MLADLFGPRDALLSGGPPLRLAAQNAAHRGPQQQWSWLTPRLSSVVNASVGEISFPVQQLDLLLRAPVVGYAFGPEPPRVLLVPFAVDPTEDAAERAGLVLPSAEALNRFGSTCTRKKFRQSKLWT